MTTCPDELVCVGSGETTRLSIIVPAYNEQDTIETVLDMIVAAPVSMSKEIIIVDDGSTDRTCQIAEGWVRQHRDTKAELIKHQTNAGKGAAVRTGIAAATGQIILIQDADLEYQPSDWPALLQPILSGEAQVVYGSRLGPLGHSQWDSTIQWLANRLLTTFTNILCGVTLSDMETCYKAFVAGVIKGLRLTARGFEIEPEITIKLSRARVRIVEVPITYHGRSKRLGKKIAWRDGVKAIWSILRYRFWG